MPGFTNFYLSFENGFPFSGHDMTRQNSFKCTSEQCFMYVVLKDHNGNNQKCISLFINVCFNFSLNIFLVENILRKINKKNKKDFRKLVLNDHNENR